MFNYSPKQLLPLINQSLANRILSLLLLASLLLSSCTSTTKIKPVTPTPTLNPLSQSANSYKPPIYSHSKPQTAQRPPKADSVSSLQTQETEPLAFIENVGQFDPRALFQVRGGDATIYLAEDAIWFTYIDLQEQQPNADSQPAINQEQKPIKTVNLKVTFPGSNTHPELVPFDKVNTHLSYVSKNDANNHKNIPV